MPHRAHQGLSGPSHSLESSVDVVNQVIALVHRVTDHLLNALGLEPGLTIREIDMSVSTVERIESARLVEHDEQIISHITVESGHVCSSESVATHGQLQ